MKKTIDLSTEALAVYDKWGHKKSEKASQAIVEFENKKQSMFTEEQEIRIREIVDLAIKKWNGK